MAHAACSLPKKVAPDVVKPKKESRVEQRVWSQRSKLAVETMSTTGWPLLLWPKKGRRPWNTTLPFRPAPTPTVTKLGKYATRVRHIVSRYDYGHLI
jgi:hypothetical protein